MTSALIERFATGTTGCRFPDWCNGSCASDRHVSGERSHFSDSRDLADPEFYNAIGVQLYGYEVPRDVSPVVVCLVVGEDDIEISSTNFTAAQSRELGNILLGVRPADFRFGDALIWHHSFDNQRLPRTRVEVRQPRDRRRGGQTEMLVDISICDGPDSASVRTQVSLRDARVLGGWLVESADQADQANREQGLVGTE